MKCYKYINFKVLELKSLKLEKFENLNTRKLKNSKVWKFENSNTWKLEIFNFSSVLKISSYDELTKTWLQVECYDRTKNCKTFEL